MVRMRSRVRPPTVAPKGSDVHKRQSFLFMKILTKPGVALVKIHGDPKVYAVGLIDIDSTVFPISDQGLICRMATQLRQKL